MTSPSSKDPTGPLAVTTPSTRAVLPDSPSGLQPEKEAHGPDFDAPDPAAARAPDLDPDRQESPQAHYALLAHHALEAVFFLSPDGRILDANAAAEKLYGYTREEFLRLTVADLRAPSEHAGIRAALAAACAQPRVFHSIHRRKDGTYFPTEASVQPVDFKGNRVLISVLRDITERRQIQMELEALFEGTHAQLALLDRSFRFVRVNSAYAAGARKPKHELIGKLHFELFPDKENQRIFERVRDTGEPFHVVERAFQFADQPERGTTWWNWSLVPIQDDRQNVRGTLLSLIEVTEQVRQRQRTEHLLKVTAALSAAQTQGQVADAVFAQALCPLGAKVGGITYEVAPGSYELLAQYECPDFAPALWHEALRTGNDLPDIWVRRHGVPFFASSGAELDALFPAFAPVRQSLGIEVWCALPLMAGGQVRGVLHAGMGGPHPLDAVEREVLIAVAQQCSQALERARLFEAERTARERVERLHAVTQACSAALTAAEVAEAVFDEGLSPLGCTVAAIYLLAGPGHLELVWDHGFPPESRDAWRRLPLDADVPLCEAARTKTPFWVRDGSDVQARYPALFDAIIRMGCQSMVTLPLIVGEQVLGVLAFACSRPTRFCEEDCIYIEALASPCALAIARASSYEKVRAESARKDHFLAMLSHELRNPLAPIRNALHVLQRSPPDGERARRALGILDRQSRHLARLVDDLLDHTRIARGKVELRRERVDLAALVQRAVEDHRAVFESRGIRLEARLDAEPLWLDADPARVLQAMGNLLMNAAKFTPAGGSAHVHCSRNGRMAEVRVSDTGQGIDPELLPQLFQPFVQGDTSLDRAGGGLGLGLSVARSLVERHGGSLSGFSEGQGKGAEFTMRLPLATAVEDESPRFES